jgi:hypothetical protein
MFMVMSAVTENGEKVLLSTSAVMAQAAVYRAKQLGILSQFPVRRHIKEEATQSGFHPISLVKA